MHACSGSGSCNACPLPNPTPHDNGVVLCTPLLSSILFVCSCEPKPPQRLARSLIRDKQGHRIPNHRRHAAASQRQLMPCLLLPICMMPPRPSRRIHPSHTKHTIQPRPHPHIPCLLSSLRPSLLSLRSARCFSSSLPHKP